MGTAGGRGGRRRGEAGRAGQGLGHGGGGARWGGREGPTLKGPILRGPTLKGPILGGPILRGPARWAALKEPAWGARGLGQPLGPLTVSGAWVGAGRTARGLRRLFLPLGKVRRDGVTSRLHQCN